MSTRESEAPESSRTSDIRDYLPSAETMAKYADPAYSDQLFHEAMAASAKARRSAQNAIEEQPVTKVIPDRKGVDGQKKKKGWPLWWTIAFAIVAIGGPILVLLIGKSIKEQPAVAPSATATTTASATATAMPTVSAAASATVIPVASAITPPATPVTASASATTKPRVAPKASDPRTNVVPTGRPSEAPPPPPPPPKPTIID